MFSKIFKITFVVIIAIIIATPLMISITGVNLNYDLNENRVLSAKPQFSWSTIETFPEKFDSYYNDNFQTRSYCIQGYNAMNYYLFKQGYNDTLVMGEDDWIFYQPSIYSNDYKRNNLLSERDLKSIADYLSMAKNFCESQGTEFYFVCAPNKSEVYPEKYPSNIKQKDGYSVLDQLEEYLTTNTDIKVINVKNTLLENKGDTTLYYSNSTHWNYYGSYIAYKEIMNTIRQDFPDLKILTDEELMMVEDEDYVDGYIEKTKWTDIETKQKMTLSLKEKNYTYEELPAPENYETKYKDSLIKTRINTSDREKLLVYRDSFFTWLLPYVSNSFNEVTYCRKFDIDLNAIETEKPTLFIYEILERHLPSLLMESKTYVCPIVIENIEPTEDMIVCVDKITATDYSLSVAGWNYLPDKDTAKQKKYIRFNLADGSKADYEVQSYYSNIGEYFENGKYDYARFNFVVNNIDFILNIVTMQFIIEDEGRYYSSSEINFSQFIIPQE